MAGIYIHIPFCKKRCTYCDFHTEVAPKMIPEIVDCIVKEMHIRQHYLKNATINTIYFGGGTPSILSAGQFKQIFEAIFQLFNVAANAEITFEANPDDLSDSYFESITPLPFNRISMGIQSFDDADLKRINRRHSGQDAVQAVASARKAGFNNISVDLIYGLPLQTTESWQKQLDTAMTLQVEHISAYGLTYEEGTALWKQREKGKVIPVADENMNEMYIQLLTTIKSHGYEAYEISNFSKPGYRSRHNTSYWKQEAYLGLGPSAHSFDLESRQWNVASNKQYVQAICEGLPFFEVETLTPDENFNDYVMVSLRTMEGIDLHYIEKTFGKEQAAYCIDTLSSYIKDSKVIKQNDFLRLTPEGVMISNVILIDLMKV